MGIQLIDCFQDGGLFWSERGDDSVAGILIANYSTLVSGDHDLEGADAARVLFASNFPAYVVMTLDESINPKGQLSGVNMTAYNTAVDCDYLRNAPASITSALILRQMDRAHLAESMIAAETDFVAAQRVVNFLAARRPEAQTFFGVAPTDEALEALIAAAQAERDTAGNRRADMSKQVSAVADEIEASVPGASTADTGIA